MELVEGPTLREWAAGTHGWRERLDVLLDVGRALSAAHGANIVHRDIKPDNILIGRGGRAVVSDFGLARSLADLDETGYACGCAGGATIKVELDGMVVGTPSYMSPEQLEGRAADSRSDQYSFAVTAWELLYGVLPFRGADVETLHRVVTAQLFEALPESTEVPGAISDALRRGMRPAASARYPSMSMFVERLTSASA
jgi:serine/threonine protein kinase